MATPTPTQVPRDAIEQMLRASGLVDDQAGDGVLYRDIAEWALRGLNEAGYQVRPHPGSSRDQWQSDELSNLISDALSWAPAGDTQAADLNARRETHANDMRGPAAVRALLDVLDQAMPFVPSDMVQPLTQRRTEILAVGLTPRTA